MKYEYTKKLSSQKNEYEKQIGQLSDQLSRQRTMLQEKDTLLEYNETKMKHLRDAHKREERLIVSSSKHIIILELF